ncbi:tetratricopeptide repeat-containing diguanylate cyclase [Planococcus lenghuensis]|uniref:GGDEF domain-containing protein n=1 Tax=Planococcus lenghuensis TaxID=2213202 RepID=A0A1Q2L4N1_9BACL|nr:GGDEF domain-containing protein [Planococcus lenghuensis]AQQ54832.1 GGDEF domain-containing protein [Planococcus lenghuensis]
MKKQELAVLQQKIASLRAEGKYKEAIEGSYELLESAMDQHDHRAMMTAYVVSAASYYSIGDIKEAFRNIEAHREVCARYGTDEDFLDLYHILFLLYEHNKDFGKAKETLKKSIKIARQLSKEDVLSSSYGNFSHLLLAEGEFTEALRMGQAGLEAARKHLPRSGILEIRVKLNITRAYIELGEYEKAWPHINEMVTSLLLDSFSREKAQSRDLLGFWYARQQRYAEAFIAYTEAKELAASYGDIYLRKAIQEERIRLSEAMDDIRLAYEVQKEYISLLEEISRQELSLASMKFSLQHRVEEIEKKANTDHLTGLYNRTYLEAAVNRWLADAAETSTSVVCIAFDIDNFKQINDEHGHLFGDEVIRQVSEACVAVFRRNDLIGRYGGDEFIIILYNATFEAGMKKAERLAETLRNLEIEKNGKTATVTASIGVSDNGEGAVTTFDELFHNADMALYRAKDDGKNRVISSY